MPVSIVTGSDSGIGRATAIELAARGHHIGITFRSDEDGAAECAEEVRARGVTAAVRRLDLSRAEDGLEVLDALVEELGGLDVLVNNAAVQPEAPVLDLDVEAWRLALEVNLTAPFLLGQRAVTWMRRHGVAGCIVNVTSVHEDVPLREAAAYCAAKGGLGQLTRSLALELGPLGVRVVSVAPGEVSTPLTGQHEADPGKQDRPKLPLGRPGHAEEIARTIAHVATEATYLTGTSVVVDGGLMLTAAEGTGKPPP